MDLFKKTPFSVPVEVAVVLAINIVMAMLGYYAVMMWGLARG
jgi:hypothetical protein